MIETVRVLIELITSPRSFVVIVVVFGFLPGFVLRLLVRLYPNDHPRRRELPNELYFLPRWERWFFVAEQLETALHEAPRARVARRKARTGPRDAVRARLHQRVPVHVHAFLAVGLVVGLTMGLGLGLGASLAARTQGMTAGAAGIMAAVLVAGLVGGLTAGVAENLEQRSDFSSTIAAMLTGGPMVGVGTMLGATLGAGLISGWTAEWGMGLTTGFGACMTGALVSGADRRIPSGQGSGRSRSADGCRQNNSARSAAPRTG